MHDFQKNIESCKGMLDVLNIPYAKNITFRVNNRWTSKLGQCAKRGDQYTIEIAAKLLDDRTPVYSLCQTILHELLHSCEGCMDHTGLWKEYAGRVNKAYDLHISRLTSREESGVPQELEKPYKYKMVCPHCGTEYKRYRMTDAFRFPDRFNCGKCRKSMAGAKRYKILIPNKK